MFARLRHAHWRAHRPQEIGRCRLESRDWLRITWAYGGLPVSLPMSIATRAGPFHFEERSDIATWWQIHCRDAYPVRGDEQIIVDAGANIGAFTLYAAAHAPQARIVAIEPSKETFARLRGHVAGAGIEHRCELIHGALGAHAGSTTIESRGGSQFRRSGHGDEVVRMIGLDEILERGPGVDLLKMDIEGGEYDVLPACRLLQRVQRIAMETHPLRNGRDADWLLDLLHRAGFVCTFEDHGEGYGIAVCERSPHTPAKKVVSGAAPNVASLA